MSEQNADYERRIQHARRDIAQAIKLLKGLPPLDIEHRGLIEHALSMLQVEMDRLAQIDSSGATS